MLFQKKSKFIQFKPQELEERSEWLFFSSLNETKEVLEQLKDIFQVDDYLWKILKKEALFEILLWEFGTGIAVLKEKLLSQEQVDDLISDLIFWLGVFFPNYKSYEIIDAFAYYVLIAREETSYVELRKKLEDHLIIRMKELFNIKIDTQNNKEISDLIFMKFSYGWVLGLDAFSFIQISRIKNANSQTRQLFRNEIVLWAEKKKEGEIEEEMEKRKEWDENLKNINKAVGGLKEELAEEIKRSNDVEKKFKKFLFRITASQPIKTQIIDWMKKEELQLTDEEIERFFELANTKFKAL